MGWIKGKKRPNVEVVQPEKSQKEMLNEAMGDQKQMETKQVLKFPSPPKEEQAQEQETQIEVRVITENQLILSELARIKEHHEQTYLLLLEGFKQFKWAFKKFDVKWEEYKE